MNFIHTASFDIQGEIHADQEEPIRETPGVPSVTMVLTH